MAYIYDLADTWNAAGTTFTAIKMNVTDTASAAGSLLMDLQVGGTPRFRVGKGGGITSALSANTPAMAVTGYSLTGSNDSALLNLAGTWNTTGTPTALLLNVTDTASNAVSRLINLQVGGNSRFSVRKDATIILPVTSGLAFTNTTDGTLGTNGIHFVYDGVGVDAGALLVRRSGQTVNLYAFSYAGINLADSWLAWGTGTKSVDQDLILRRDAANTLAQRNGTNAQAFRIYNTFTDASNYERGKIEWASNVLRIGTEKAGTGSARALELQTDGVTALTVSNNQEVKVNTDQFVVQRKTGGGDFGQIVFGTTNAGSHALLSGDFFRFRNRAGNAGAFFEMIEMTAPAAPAANEVRIYAEDDGAGKTRLMARFATGAAVQIAIEP